MKPGPKPYPWNHPKTVARFLSFVEPDPLGSDCRLFTGSVTRGWGRFVAQGFPGAPAARVYAHRYSYRVWVGEIPDGFDVHHRHHICSFRNCVHDEHLEALGHTSHGVVSTDYQHGRAYILGDTPGDEFL